MNIKVLFSVRAHKYNLRVGETDTGILWSVSCIFHLVANSHNQKDPEKMESLWKITMMNLQAARYMLSSQAPLPGVCCLLKPVTKVHYIFFCLYLFPVSLAVNKEVECLGETVLIIEVRILLILLICAFSLPLSLQIFTLPIIFTQSANYNQLHLILIHVHRILTVSWIGVQLSDGSRF